jgi:hypothetical protein
MQSMTPLHTGPPMTTRCTARCHAVAQPEASQVCSLHSVQPDVTVACAAKHGASTVHAVLHVEPALTCSPWPAHVSCGEHVQIVMELCRVQLAPLAVCSMLQVCMFSNHLVNRLSQATDTGTARPTSTNETSELAYAAPACCDITGPQLAMRQESVPRSVSRTNLVLPTARPYNTVCCPLS